MLKLHIQIPSTECFVMLKKQATYSINSFLRLVLFSTPQVICLTYPCIL